MRNADLQCASDGFGSLLGSLLEGIVTSQIWDIVSEHCKEYERS